MDEHYTLFLDSPIKLNLESINLDIISSENMVDEYEVIYVKIMENQYYETQEVGAYKNVVYINHSGIDNIDVSSVEIRLSLISLSEDSIRNIFIRATKYPWMANTKT